MASTAASASEIQGQLAQVYADQVNNQYVSVAMAAWFLWDHVTTLDQEIKFIWSRRHFKSLTVVFLLVRYGISIAYPLSLYASFTKADVSTVCPYSDTFLVIFALLGHAVQLILALRVYALYDRSRQVGIFLSLLFLALLGISFNLIVSYFMGGRSPVPPVVPGSAQLFGCLMNPIPGYFRSLVATTVFESVIVGMTIWNVTRPLRRQRNIPLINYLLSSGISYYVAMLAMLILNLLTEPLPVLKVPVLSSSCILVVQGVACSHIVLGMLRQGEKSITQFPAPSPRKPEESNIADTTFSIPTGVYSKDMPEDWERSLPPLDMSVLLEDDDEETGIPLGPVSSSTVPSNV